MNFFSCLSCFGIGLSAVINPNVTHQRVMITPEGVVVKGVIVDDELEGNGEVIYPNFMKEKGFFKHTMLDGEGCITLPTGTVMKGLFRDGSPIDIQVISKDGKVYRAKFTENGIEIER